jgi:hypothetical protein
LKAVLVAFGVTIFMVGGAGAVEGIDLKNSQGPESYLYEGRSFLGKYYTLQITDFWCQYVQRVINKAPL